MLVVLRVHRAVHTFMLLVHFLTFHMHRNTCGWQDPSNKRTILCDEAMEKVFGRKKMDMFKMTKLLR